MTKPTDKHAESEKRWSEWMRRASLGDREAYGALMTEVGDAVEAYLRQRFGAASFVEDCVQETLLAVHRSRASWQADRPFRPWLFAILRYKAIDALRSRNVRRKVELESEIETEGGAGSVGEVAVLPEATRDPAREIDGARLLETLSAPHREAILMTKFHGLSIKEAAQHCGLSQTAMKTRVSRALREVRRRLAREDEAVFGEPASRVSRLAPRPGMDSR